MILRSLLLASAVALTAAPAVAGDLTLERVFASPSLNGETPRLPKLSPDGKLVTLLRPRAADRERFDLWAIDTGTGQARMLVDSEKVGSGAEVSEAEKMRRERLRIASLKGILAYDWAPDGKSILVPLDGDLFVATLDGQVRRLTETEATEIDAHVSDGGKYVSFVRDQNLYVIAFATGQEHALTTDGKDTVTWGTAEFVAQEELDRFTGQWWSPDDKRIAVQRTDESKVNVVHRASIGASGTTVYDQRYPAAGTPNAEVELWLMNPDGGGRVKADLGQDPDFYLARVDWAPDGSAVYVQRLNREQTRIDMLKVDPATGRSTVVFSEVSKPKSWVNLTSNYRFLKDGSLIWWSERDGWGHLYRWKAGRWTQLTRGEWAVSDLLGVDEAKHRLFFQADRETPLEQQVYSIDYARPGRITQLTESGWNAGATMDQAATRMIVNRSNPDQPPQVYLADTAGKRLAWIEENRLDQSHPYYPYLDSHRPAQFGTIKTGDGATLYWEMITPKLEPGKRYPVFFSHYGGPHSQVVSRSWTGALAQYWVDKGYIFFEIDNRGSPNRGKGFEDAIWHAMGSVEVEDQVAGANWLKAQPFVDPNRINIFGWSYGGYMTLKMLEKHPGVFAAGIAVAPVTRWELYDTAYTERYMGDPKTDGAAYKAADALPFAADIKDPLLMIHGMADDNVVFQNSTEFYAALQQAKVPFELMVYPGKAHGIPGADIQTHVYGTIERFLDAQVKTPK